EGIAKQDFHQDKNKPIVPLQLKDAENFADVTTTFKIMGTEQNLLVICLDFVEGEDAFLVEVGKDELKYISASAVSSTLNTTNVQIEGDFTVEEAQRLADIINSGSLPVHMTELYSTSVGAQFGEQALNETVFAGIIGIAIIFLYMIFT